MGCGFGQKSYTFSGSVRLGPPSLHEKVRLGPPSAHVNEHNPGPSEHLGVQWRSPVHFRHPDRMVPELNVYMSLCTRQNEPCRSLVLHGSHECRTSEAFRVQESLETWSPSLPTEWLMNPSSTPRVTGPTYGHLTSLGTAEESVWNCKESIMRPPALPSA